MREASVVNLSAALNHPRSLISYLPVNEDSAIHFICILWKEQVGNTGWLTGSICFLLNQYNFSTGLGKSTDYTTINFFVNYPMRMRHKLLTSKRLLHLQRRSFKTKHHFWSSIKCLSHLLSTITAALSLLNVRICSKLINRVCRIIQRRQSFKNVNVRWHLNTWTCIAVHSLKWLLSRSQFCLPF